MKNTFIVTIIILLSYFAWRYNIPSHFLLVFYAFFSIVLFFAVFLKRHVTVGFSLWFLMLLLPYAGKIPIPMLPDISIERLIWLLLFAIFIFELIFHQRKVVAGDITLEILMAILCVYILYSMIVAGTLYAKGGGLQLSTFQGGYFLPFLIFFLGKQMLDDGKKIKRVFVFFLVIGFYLGITGIFEILDISTLVFPKYIINPFEGIHWGRARGPLLNASANGTILGMIFFISGYIMQWTDNKKGKILIVIAMTVIAITILLTYTRACWGGFILAMLAGMFFFNRSRIILFLVGLILLSISLLSILYMQDIQLKKVEAKNKWTVIETDKELSISDKVLGRFQYKDSVYGRFAVYKTIGNMIMEKPLLGVGFEKFKEIAGEYTEESGRISSKEINIHDTLSGVLVELGVLGLVIYMSIFIIILLNSIKCYRQLPDDGWLNKKIVIVFWCMSIVYIFNMQFIQMRYFGFVNSLFFLMAGIIEGMRLRSLQPDFLTDKKIIGVQLDEART